MKRWMLSSLFMLLFLVGCTSHAQWEATVKVPPSFSVGEACPIEVSITENGKPVSGLQVEAQVEMKGMDHGTIDIAFQDKGDGTYEGAALLPMGGEWEAVVKMSGDGNSQEQTVQFKIEGMQK
ncbi:FixH family protein [Aneurinibacillus sp. REN35]|uniref:FixH family protein n=1 Tax=Aneurinibacillus sp. REN35 TaxID=3237286 RepID=UPI003528C2C8